MALLNNQNIEFIEFKNRLKTVARTGWKEIGIPDEEVESVYSHIASTKDLVAEFNEKFELELDLDKMFKMITIKELPKAYTQEEKSVLVGGSSAETNKNIINEIKEHFNLSDEFVAIYDEFVQGETKEAKYALLFSKFESDLQAVDYYKRGLMKLDPVLSDIEYYPEDIKAQAKARLDEYPIPPLGWLTYDSTYYVGNELFTNLSNELIQYCIKLYEAKKEQGNTLK